MHTVSSSLFVQTAMGAFAKLWHPELQDKLPQRISAPHALVLHAARKAICGIVFIGLAWFEWRGAFAAGLAALLLAELGITLVDFLEDDRARRSMPFKRVLHALLTISYGLFLGFFAPVLLSWAQLPTGMAFTPREWVSWLCTLYGFGVLTLSLRTVAAAMGLRRVAQTGHSPAQPVNENPGTPAVLVTGATGFVGQALVTNLRRDGRRVIALSRDARQASATFGPGVWVVESLDAIPPETRIDAIVNLAGARVLGLPWTASRRRTLLASRVGVTAAVVDLMRSLQQTPSVLVSASAVGFYGASPNASFAPRDESAGPHPGELQSDLCAAIEHEARRAEALGVRVVRMRFGVVLGRGGGAYPMLAFSARLGLGTVLGSGRQAAPWIHLDDAVGLVRFALAQGSLQGPVNAVAPDAQPQAQFAKALAASFGRSVWLRMPDAPLRTVLGEMSTLLLDGQNATPSVALAAGYRFIHPTLEGSLRALRDLKV